MIYNFIIIMSTGYVHQVRIVGENWEEIKDKEMEMIQTMMEIDFWRQINHTMLMKIEKEKMEPRFSIEYDLFLKEIRSMRSSGNQIK